MKNSKSIIDDKTILIFDEFLLNDNWEQDEYKALTEFCATFDLKYDVLAVSFVTKQVAVRVLEANSVSSRGKVGQEIVDSFL